MKVNVGYATMMLTLALCLSPVCASAGSVKKTEEKPEATARQTKTPYEKFVSKKGLVAARGHQISVFKDGEKVYIEYPDSLMGRELCLSSHVSESSDQMIENGLDISGQSTDFRIYRTDSLVIFRIPKSPLLLAQKDSSTLPSFEISRSEAVKYAFPIKYRNADSTAVVFDATSLFDSSDETFMSLKRAWIGNVQIVSQTKDNDVSGLRDVMAFGESIAVIQDVTYDVSLQTQFSSRASVTVVTTLSVLEENLMPLRKADDRIGLRTVNGQEYDSKYGFNNVKLATRWDLRNGKKIKVYVDTLMPASWQKAVKDGLCAWNPAFEKAGLGESVVEVLSYPKDSSFSAFNPLVSKVSFCGGAGRSVSARISLDERSGEIRSFSIDIPGDYLTGLLFSTSFAIADVDSRYTDYFLPDDAVCEVLKANIMSIFGYCLGLGSNCAGSLAYTPDELRSPDFTRAHGITASVMDKVLFNILARPGDKEKGVVTIVDRVGPYDEYVIDWLYASYSDDPQTQHSLDSLISSKSGQREFLYLPYDSRNPDPRANVYDLGSDPFESFDSALSHLRYTAQNAHLWYNRPDVPEESFRQLYVEWLWLRLLDCTKILSPLVGGVYSSNVRADNDQAYFTAVPEEMQRQAVCRVLTTLMDLSWLDRNKELMTMSGLYTTYNGLTRINMVTNPNMIGRLPYIARSQRIAGGTYTREAFLDDFQDIIFANISKGEIGIQEDDLIMRYLYALVNMSPVMKTSRERAFRLSGNRLDDSLFVPLSGVYTIDVDGQDIVARKALEKARKALVQGRSRAKNVYNKGRIDFLIHMIDVSL